MSQRPTPQQTIPDRVLRGYGKAVDLRLQWEPLWQECYTYALPQRNSMCGALGAAAPGRSKTELLFDGTAPDGVDQLASSLLGELTPPWGQWFSLTPGVEASEQAAHRAGKTLATISDTIRGHFERSNFAVEMHQCFLDLVTAGTACLLFEEAPAGSSSAFRFTAVPLTQVAFAEGPGGVLDTTWRRSELSREELAHRFPSTGALEAADGERNEDKKFSVIEAVRPADATASTGAGANAKGKGFSYCAILHEDSAGQGSGTVLAEGSFSHAPFINFRWLKAPGEIYGRSPVMKALPDIKTANKVVELILKNASIAVSGIWQAEDDGVLNPEKIHLAPGMIITKAPGSQGLTPLKPPGDFDLSQLVLADLRQRIRSALLVDNLGQVNAPGMTATEVLERSAEISRLLGATYGRLQSELLVPLMHRALSILVRRGDVPAFELDGRAVTMSWRSPLARTHSRYEARDAIRWMETIQAMGPQAMEQIDPVATVRWLARALDIPETLLRASGGSSTRPSTRPSAQPVDHQEDTMP